MLGKRVMVNSVTALATNVLIVLLGFVLQRVMVATLGAANIGLNSVFTNIVSILSLAELGISTAIVYHLYLPLAQHDEASIRSLMRLYAKAYHLIAVLVMVLGMVLMPFLPLFLKDSPFSTDYIRLIFLLFLVRTAVSYLLSYRRSLVMADQKTYIVSWVDLATQFLSIGVGAVILLTTKSFALYLASCCVWTIAGNLVIALIVRRQYPYLRQKTETDALSLFGGKVFKDVKNIFIMRISGVILTSTDSVIISSFVSVVAAGLYDNYSKLSQGVLMLVSAVTSAVQPTLGHLFASAEHKQLDPVLRSYTFAFYLLGSILGSCLLCLMTPFVTQIWLGLDYELAFPIVCLLTTNFFLVTVRNPLWSMLSVSGLFAQDKNISIVGATSNLIVSLALVGPLGISGVLIGTFVSQLLQVVLKTRLLYRRGLETAATVFARQLTSYFLLFFAQATACYLLCQLISFGSPLGNLILRGLLCLCVTIGLNAALFCRSERWQAVRATVGTLFHKEEAA